MVNRLKEDILTSKLQTGDYLPSEKSLGEQFHLSNRSVRKGLEVLVREGLIVKVPKVGNRVTRPDDSGTLTVRFGYYKSMAYEADLHHLLTLFQEQYPQIRVQAVPIAGDVGIKEYLEAGLLDAATVNYPTYQSILDGKERDWLEEQTPDPSMYPYVTHAFTADGLLMAKPFLFSPLVLCYNREHIRANGLLEPDSGWSWQDLSQVASQLTRPNERLGFYFHLQSRNRWPVFLLQSGGSLRKEPAGRPIICGTDWMEGFKVCRDLIVNQRTMPMFDQESDAEELFRQGKASMIMTSYFAMNRLRSMKGDWDIAPLPHLRNGKTLLLVIGLIVNRNSSRKEAARKLIDFLTSYPAQLAVRKNTLSIPALKPAAEWTGSDSHYRPQRFHLYREVAPTFSFYDELGLSNDDIVRMTQQAKMYWSGLCDEQQLCESLERCLSG